MLYPRRYKAFTLKDYLGLVMELINVFDIMEMMTDVKYMHKYERIWEVLYYVDVGMAMILISFPIEINADDLAWSKITLEENSKS